MKTNYQNLFSTKDPVPLLDRWRGGRADLWGYTVSHRVLEIRIQHAGEKGCLYISCGDVQYICGPTKWDDCDLLIERTGVDEITLSDRRARFEVRAGILGAAEM